jgi:mono/diheme cytochrome c family protein
VLTDFNFDDFSIILDLKELLASSDLTQDTPDSSAGCQSFPDDVNECTPLFPQLGLSFETGKCIGDCGQQRAFRAGRVRASANDVAAAVARGAVTFTTTHDTTSGSPAACASCHGPTGVGVIGPDIRSSGAEHLQGHAQGDLPHPAGVKFTTLTDADFADIGYYLASICAADPGCEPGGVDHHHEH